MAKGMSRRHFLELTAAGIAALAGSVYVGTSMQESSGDASTERSHEPGILTALFPKVGKADAIILSTGSSCVVVDTGTAAKGGKVCEALEELGVTTIDALVITHFDQDHVGGAADVINSFDVAKLYVSSFRKESDEVDALDRACAKHGLTAQVVNKTMRLAFDGITYTLIPPEKLTYDNDASNNSSIVARVEHGDVSLLLAGDIERERISQLLASNVDLSCDLLKVPHHGRVEKNSAAFFAAVSPRYAVVTSSKAEPEDDEVMEALEEVGAEVFLTRKNSVHATSDGTSISVAQD